MDTRQRIIETALSVFLTKGYEGASMNEIARQARITKGGIYHHFESKEHLFREAIGYITVEMGKWSATQFREVKSAQGLLAALFGSIASMKDAFAAIVGAEGEERPYSFLEVLVNAARRNEDVRREMGAVYAHTRENIKQVLDKSREAGEIRGDIDCEALAFEITALMEGTMLLSVIDETVDLETVGDKLYENIWAMVKA